MAIYTGVSGVAREVSAPYIGVSGVAREVGGGYIGVSNVARQWRSQFLPAVASYSGIDLASASLSNGVATLKIGSTDSWTWSSQLAVLMIPFKTSILNQTTYDDDGDTYYYNNSLQIIGTNVPWTYVGRSGYTDSGYATLGFFTSSSDCIDYTNGGILKASNFVNIYAASGYYHSCYQTWKSPVMASSTVQVNYSYNSGGYSYKKGYSNGGVISAYLSNDISYFYIVLTQYDKSMFAAYTGDVKISQVWINGTRIF